MDLILWRHAEAHPADRHQDDLARELTRKGERQARRMAAWLDQHLPDGARVWTSPAIRAQQTAAVLGRKFKTLDELLPEADAAQVLALTKWGRNSSSAAAKGALVLVGHQPWQGRIASMLLSLDEPACGLRKGAVWWLRSNGDAGDEVGASIVAIMTPDLVAVRPESAK